MNSLRLEALDGETLRDRRQDMSSTPVAVGQLSNLDPSSLLDQRLSDLADFPSSVPEEAIPTDINHAHAP